MLILTCNFFFFFFFFFFYNNCDILKNSSALMIKKLRYYARFIVVCLLLNHYETIKQLMEELNLLVDEYTKVFKPSDAAEWNVVITEISNFLEVC